MLQILDKHDGTLMTCSTHGEMQAVVVFTILLAKTLEVCRLLSSDVDFKCHVRTLGRKKGRGIVNHDSPTSPPVSPPAL